MAYDEKLVGRIRKVLARRKALTEKKMFGGIAFMVGGNMCCGVVGDELMVRIGAEHYESALSGGLPLAAHRARRLPENTTTPKPTQARKLTRRPARESWSGITSRNA